MEIISPESMTCSFFGGRVGYPAYSLTLVVKGIFNLKNHEAAIATNEELYPTGGATPDEEGSCRYGSDFAYFKPKTDLLFAGTCYTPNGSPSPVCRVAFGVGDKIKHLNVFGDRHWVEGYTDNISDPVPFTEMELCYENSYGGEGFNKNPVGTGYQQKLSGSDDRLPNIENPQQLISSQDCTPEPVGFGPLGAMWESRKLKLGTYNDEWLKERWPWFPKDFDWSYYNAAPDDMQMEGYLRGDERLYFENLHPEHSQYHSQLPGVRARCFVNKIVDAEKDQVQFQEIPMNLDTLWVDMEKEQLVLVWRGNTAVESEDFDEIKQLYIVSEALGQSEKTSAYYEAELLKSIEDEKKPYEVNKPAWVSPEIPDFTKEIAEAERNLRAALIEAGIDPDAEPPEKSDAEKQAEADLLKRFGIEEPRSSLTRELFIERLDRKESFSEEDLSGLDLSHLDLSGIDFSDAILTNARLEYCDLSDANLCGLIASQIQLSQSTLKGAQLKMADFTGSTITDVDFTSTDLTDAIFEGCKVKAVSFDQVDAVGADFSDATLARCNFKKSDLSGVSFSKSVLNGVDFSGSNLTEASIEGAAGNHLNFSETTLTELRASEGCHFKHANFNRASGFESIWENAKLDEADFSYSDMQSANFTGASLIGSNFTCANLKFSKFRKANLTRAHCVSMNLFQGSLERACVKETNFSDSNLYGVEFLDAVGGGTNFSAANIKMTKLDK